jgi:hypothetical protein
MNINTIVLPQIRKTATYKHTNKAGLLYTILKNDEENQRIDGMMLEQISGNRFRCVNWTGLLCYTLAVLNPWVVIPFFF